MALFRNFCLTQGFPGSTSPRAKPRERVWGQGKVEGGLGDGLEGPGGDACPVREAPQKLQPAPQCGAPMSGDAAPSGISRCLGVRCSHWSSPNPVLRRDAGIKACSEKEAGVSVWMGVCMDVGAASFTAMPMTAFS